MVQYPSFFWDSAPALWIEIVDFVRRDAWIVLVYG